MPRPPKGTMSGSLAPSIRMGCSGRPEDVSRHPEYHALFGGHAAELAVYLHHHDHAHAEDGKVVHDHDGDCCHG